MKKKSTKTYEELLEYGRNYSRNYYKLHRQEKLDQVKKRYQKLKNDSIKQNKS